MKAMPAVFDALMKAGEAHAIRLFGTYAMNSLRMEKAYRGWGGELTNEVDMFRGLDGPLHPARQVTTSSEAKRACASSSGAPHQARLYVRSMPSTTMRAATSRLQEWQGRRITTSGGYGFAVGKSLASPIVEPALAPPKCEEFDIMLLGDMRRARTSRPARMRRMCGSG